MGRKGIEKGNTFMNLTVQRGKSTIQYDKYYIYINNNT